MAMRIIDPQAARYAVQHCYPNAPADESIKWIASQLALKARGLQHADRAVAIYEEHAKT